ncbi:hypothetical protein ACLBWH_10345 [Sphingomonas sp. M6A6_1c]
MGLTLLAVLVTALLLPGIIAAKAFYQAAQTKEVEPAVPPLTSVDGIAQVGLFSVAQYRVQGLQGRQRRGEYGGWRSDRRGTGGLSRTRR